MDYDSFLRSKHTLAEPVGFEVPEDAINPMLRGKFEYQSDIVRWALRRGKAAIFAHTGMGKGPMQLEWLSHVQRHTSDAVMLLAPLAVAEQFQLEADKFHVPVRLCRKMGDIRNGINVTNYDRIGDFDLSQFPAVAMDESSCIKDWTSKTTSGLIDVLRGTPFKLCSSATPSPNSHSELGTHAELLDVMRRVDMLAMFFEHDGGETSKWVLKGHGKRPFFRFVASWAVCLMKPSDLGYNDEGFDLPPLNLQQHIVSVDHGINTNGMLFRNPDLSATGLHNELRLTVQDRARRVAELVAREPHEQWLLWCNTNYEADAVRALIPGIVEVRGSDHPDKKKDALIGFATGAVRYLLSKPSIAGYGMNYQNCCNMAFVGLSYSFEDLFQAIRRCWRFGQTRPVNAHIVIAETEGPVLETIKRKESQYEELQAEMNTAMREEQLQARRKATRYDHSEEMRLPAWL
jgi:hypothetical protein